MVADCEISFCISSTLTALLALVLSWRSASVLSARAGADRVNIMHAARAADAARRTKTFRFIEVPPFGKKILRRMHLLP